LHSVRAAEQVLTHVKAALENDGSSVAQLAQARVHIVDVEHRARQWGWCSA
jgi:enamine deaminase RidA (YjgF/YER057c/UK114 family)